MTGDGQKRRRKPTILDRYPRRNHLSSENGTARTQRVAKDGSNGDPERIPGSRKNHRRDLTPVWRQVSMRTRVNLDINELALQSQVQRTGHPIRPQMSREKFGQRQG